MTQVPSCEANAEDISTKFVNFAVHCHVDIGVLLKPVTF
jgi:hypothetical protein